MPVKEVKTAQDIQLFLDLEAEVYKDDPCWVPGIRKEITSVITGISPFSPYVSQQAFYYERQGKATARVCVFINRYYIEQKKENIEFFGYFEALPGEEECVNELIAIAGEWLKGKGMVAMIGPINSDPVFGFALRIDKYDQLPGFPYMHAKPYYKSYVYDNLKVPQDNN